MRRGLDQKDDQGLGCFCPKVSSCAPKYSPKLQVKRICNIGHRSAANEKAASPPEGNQTRRAINSMITSKKPETRCTTGRFHSQEIKAQSAKGNSPSTSCSTTKATLPAVGKEVCATGNKVCHCNTNTGISNPIRARESHASAPFMA